jgi:hypothetical protein
MIQVKRGVVPLFIEEGMAIKRVTLEDERGGGIVIIMNEYLFGLLMESWAIGPYTDLIVFNCFYFSNCFLILLFLLFIRPKLS